MVVTSIQNVASHSAISTVGAEAISALQGRYRNEAVQQVSHNSLHQHPLSFAALVGSQMMTLRRETNLKDLVDRMRQNPNLILSAQSSFDALIAEMPPQDQQLLAAVFQFLEGLQQQAAMLRRRRRSGSSGRDDERDEGPEEDADHESIILDALEGMQSEEGKHALLSVARGYFDGLGDADLDLLNTLDKIAGQYERIAGPAAAPEETGPATLETDPRAVRVQFRQKLRDATELGVLFEELAGLDIEGKLLEDIGRDLSALGRASDRDYVVSLTRELSRLWQLRSVGEECKELIVETKAHLGRHVPPPDAADMTARVLHFCSKTTVNQNDTLQLLVPVQNAPLQGQVVFGNGLMDLHARLPDGLWPSVKERSLQYSALRAMCDRLADAEERAAAEAGSAGGWA